MSRKGLNANFAAALRTWLIYIPYGVAMLCTLACSENAEILDAPLSSGSEGAVQQECMGLSGKICTREYRPVCAVRDTGVRCVTTPCPSTEKVTYPNACSACADASVYSYSPGNCLDTNTTEL